MLNYRIISDITIQEHKHKLEIKVLADLIFENV